MLGSGVSYIPCQGARFAESLHKEKGGRAESSHELGTWTMLQPVRAIFQTSQIREELRIFLLHGRKLFVQFALASRIDDQLFIGGVRCKYICVSVYVYIDSI